MARERSSIVGENVKTAKKLKLRLKAPAFSAAERDSLRKLVPLQGRRFDREYLKLESRFIPGDATRATEQASGGRSSKVRALAAERASTYRAELEAARAAGA